MKPYSSDLRQKVINAHNNQEGSQRQLAKRFSVSLSFVQSLLRRYRNSGTVEAKPRGGGQKPKLNHEQLALVELLVESDNDATLVELCEQLEQKTQLKISRSTMGRITQKLNLTRKKKHCTPAKNIPNGCKN
ncbi:MULTISPECIES: helix-turn-helix domain-containing protein [Nostoc]|uniref:Transposase n=2 Tax=Nostoc TaxID=1177 RepID=A0A2K8T657_9NOSO|nr:MULTISPECIES: helix-turn-helix domain-containing protein [Nostoc]AUB43187.1 Transposase [Nostoc flagelliforme CCNUN1]AUB44134.1 Transposase [Nostoc flagelliforme CCNUN1]MCC5604056.1 transposase [Nostoc favosum CHAB5714]